MCCPGELWKPDAAVSQRIASVLTTAALSTSTPFDPIVPPLPGRSAGQDMEDEVDELRRACKFWVKRQVLSPVQVDGEAGWEVLEHLPPDEAAGVVADTDDEDEDDEAGGGENSEELKIFILGILGNSGFKAVPLASIGNMLKMWAQSGAFVYNKSVVPVLFASGRKVLLLQRLVHH